MLSLNKKIFQLLLVLAVSCCSKEVAAQNINSPNKIGPLGAQVNTISGNLFIPRTDVLIPSRGLDIDLSFYYNSFFLNDNFGFGKGWTSMYTLFYRNDTASGKTIFWGDGREDKYTSAGSSAYTSPKGIFNVLTEYQSGKFLLTQPDGIKYFFDNNVYKKVTKIQEPNGNTLSFTYTDSLLTGITNTAGQTITLSYNPQGNLTTVTDAITSPARTYSYAYDNSGTLKQVTDPAGNTVKYSYLVNGPMKTFSDKNNNTLDIIYYPDFTVSELIGCNKRQSFSYDSTQLVTTVTDYLDGGNQVTKYTYQKAGDFYWLSSLTGNCCGYNLNFEFDNNGNRTKQTDAKGNVTAYTYDSRGNVLTIKDALNQTLTYTYSSDLNRVTSFTDAKGLTTTMQYDAGGNVTKITTPGNINYTATYNSAGDILTSTDPKGNVYTYNYDPLGNPVNVTGPSGYHAALSYDARGNLLSVSDARGNTNSLEFDILDRLKKITDPINNNVTFGYDAAGNIIQIKNQNNELTNLKYDASNRMTQFKDALNNMTTITYDAMDNVTGFKNASGNQTSFNYDTRNRLSNLKDAEGNNVVLGYDANGNITSATLPNGQTINYTYDETDKLKTVRDNNGSVATIAYDRNENVVSITKGNGGTTAAAYDNLNRMTQVTDPLGHNSIISYDNNDNPISVTDRNGITQYYSYDSLNRVKTYTDRNGFVITMAYDAQSNVASLTDQNNNTTGYTYDSLNRVKTITLPDGKFMQYGYDKKGNIISKRVTDGSVINYAYDQTSRLTTKTLPDGQIYSYTYDAAGRVLTATNNAGTVTFTYDAISRVTSETFDGRTTRYNYNTTGRTQTIIYPDNTEITKTFDVRNNLISIAKNNTVLVTYQYNNANQPISESFANGVTRNMQYDFAGRLTGYTAGSGNIQNATISYNNEAQKTAVYRLNNPASSEQFTYDNGRRLTDYKRGIAGGSSVVHNTYGFDNAGNRTTLNANGINTIYSHNNLNQLTGSTGPQNINFTYDNNGNLTYDGSFYKKYDAEGRLVKDSSAPSNVLTYLYDALGRRVQKTYNGSLLKYSYAGLSQIEERNGITGVLNTRTIFKNFLTPAVNEKNNNDFFYHQNELNSVEAITDAQGLLIEKYEYDPYGKPSRYDSSGNPLAFSASGNRVGFTGQEFDSANNSYRFHFRNYNPATGTFDQRDPTGYADGTAMYQYVGNDPANGIDILGLEKDPCPPGTVSKAEKDFNDNLSHLTNWLSIISTELKRRDIDLSENAKYKKASLALNITSLIVKTDLLRQNYNNMSTKDVQIELAEIELAVAGIANDAGAFKAVPAFGESVSAISAVDALSQEATGHSLSYHYAHLSDASEHLGSVAARKNQERFERLQNYIDAAYKTQGKDVSKWTKEAQEQYDILKRVLKFNQENVVQNPKPDCPHNNNTGGTRRKTTYRYDPKGDSVEIVQSHDPNAILGPDGQPNKKWVSVHDVLPYTILYENSKSATAPAKFVRVTYPIDAKQDRATFALGSFGFNNQTYTIPANTSTYSKRLDARDSLGLFVDITAGLDGAGNTAFWEFQAIDPVTLLPPSDPLKGFLLLQDTTKQNSGHGFVNFNIKPKQTDITLDTIHAEAKIVFDGNDTIPTNYHMNTVDAFAPTSHMTPLPATSNNPVALSWSGIDDTNGCGVKYYTLYVSTDGVNYNIVRSNITRTDTLLAVAPNTNFSFFVLATDSVGNTEVLRPGEVRSTFVGGVVPLTMLYFRGTNQGKNNFLEWSTATEQNTADFRLERSFTGSNFTTITTVPAAGNSSTVRNYSYTDVNIDKLGSPIFYYRLKQFNTNGTFTYSNIVRLNYKEIAEIVKSLIYPNPTRDVITLVIGDRSLRGTIAYLYDVNGRMLEVIKINADSQTINLGKYMAGNYFLKLANKETIAIIKL